MGSQERIAILRALATGAPGNVGAGELTAASELAIELGLRPAIVQDQLSILELTGRVKLEQSASGLAAVITPAGREFVSSLLGLKLPPVLGAEAVGDPQKRRP